MSNEFTQAIQQAAEDEFDKGEIERIVRIDEETGTVEIVRSQPEEGPRIPRFLSNDLAVILRDRGRVREGMGAKRPYPPQELLEAEETRFEPSPEIADWLRKAFVESGLPTYNEDHAHLDAANIAVLWTNEPYTRKMKPVAGTAEIPKPHSALSGWAKARHTFQMLQWFGDVPDFLITLDASYSAECDDLAFGALIEHELYHCALKGYTKKGKPIWGILGHDTEEFTGIVRRYGVDASAGDVRGIIEAAKKVPEIGAAKIAVACGTCRIKVA